VELLKGEVVHIPKRPGEPDYTYADTAKIRKLIGWSPSVSFEQGVKITLDNIGYWKNAPVWTPENIEVANKDWFKYLSEDHEKEYAIKN
jgi:UDP-glucose 4-epimerase